jgi:endonuclease III
MLALGEEGLIEHIRTIGLYRNKAKNVMRLSRILIEEYDGEVPSSRAALSSLPGVGRKTANVVLNMWWRHPTQAVDTHIFRVANRTDTPCTRITGLSCTGAIPAWRASRNAATARSAISVSMRKRLHE